MILLAYVVLLVSVCSYAFARGGQPERLTAAIFIVATAASVAASARELSPPGTLQVPILVIDIAVAIAIAPIMAFANRLWPMVIMAMQILSVLAHFIKLLDPTVNTVLYWIVNAVWAIPQVMILGVGVHRHVRRERRSGVEQSWSNTLSRWRATGPKRPPTN